MRGGWGRWRGYMDELEEVMRVCGEHLCEVEARLAANYERSTWRGRRRDSVPSEITRRALDIPFLRELILTARSLERIDDLENAEFEGSQWREGRDHLLQPTATRITHALANEARTAPHDPEPVPARIRAAERALAGRTRSLVVVLEKLVNPRNISAVVRTTEALGLQELHIVHAEGKPRLDRTLAIDSHRWLDLFWYRESEQVVATLRERGYRILAADFDEASLPVESVPLGDRVALVFGSEQYGVSETTKAAADGFFHLPTPGFTSYLNVSVAAGISLYAVDRRMREAGLRGPLSESEKQAMRPAWYTLLAGGDGARARRYLGWLQRGGASLDTPR